jgi:hypothetical protein
MSTPNAALVAAAPILNTVIDQLTILVTTVLTGDPAQIPLRFDGAVKVFVGNLELQLPGLAVAEIGVVQTEITSGLASLKAKLNAATTPAA